MPDKPKTFRMVTRQARPREHRASASDRGYDRTWQKLARAFLDEHPLCVMCLDAGRSVSATQVDHKIPITGKDDPSRLDPRALQALCDSCHSKKTCREDGGGFRPGGKA